MRAGVGRFRAAGRVSQHGRVGRLARRFREPPRSARAAEWPGQRGPRIGLVPRGSDHAVVFEHARALRFGQVRPLTFASHPGWRAVRAAGAPKLGAGPYTYDERAPRRTFLSY